MSERAAGSGLSPRNSPLGHHAAEGLHIREVLAPASFNTNNRSLKSWFRFIGVLECNAVSRELPDGGDALFHGAPLPCVSVEDSVILMEPNDTRGRLSSALACGVIHLNSIPRIAANRQVIASKDRGRALLGGGSGGTARLSARSPHRSGGTSKGMGPAFYAGCSAGFSGAFIALAFSLVATALAAGAYW